MHGDLGFESHVTEQRFRLLVNAVTDYAIFMLDPAGRVASWNPGAQRFKGYEAEEIIGQHFSRFFLEEEREADVPRRILDTAAREGKFEAEGWRVRKDGTRYWAHVVVDPVWSPGGKLLGYAKITRDITERHRAQQELAATERRFRLLVQGVRDYALCMLDEKGCVSNWNVGAERITGYSAKDIIGQHFSCFYTDDDREAGLPAQALEQVFTEGRYEAEAWRKRKDGSRFWANVVIDQVHDDDGQFISFAKITRDITEKLAAQQDLEETRAALFQSQKLQALGELTGGVAHDFNNLLTVIRGSADLLRSPNITDDKRQRYLDAIIETADRAATLTSHLLAFSRRQSLSPKVIDVNVRLDAFAEMLSRTLDSQIEVRLDLAQGLWLAEVDVTHLETALLNAAFNARDAMPTGGVITISTRNVSEKEGDFICISIADTGEGIPPELLSRVIEPFFTTKPVGKGTGLGLSQIHGFAAQSGGRATVESAQGVGTTIGIYLPRTTRNLGNEEQAKIAPVTHRGGRVLLVEDNEHVREFARGLLQDLGFDVLSAGSAEAALEIFRDVDVDIVFSDVVMPDFSGFELAQRIHEQKPGLPVVLASGYYDHFAAEPAVGHKIIRKPYGAESLAAAFAEVIGKAEDSQG